MPSDARFKTHFLDHHKIKRLKRLHGAEAVLAWIRLVCYAVDQNNDFGDLSTLDTEELAGIADWNGDAQELEEALFKVRLLEKQPDSQKTATLIKDLKEKAGGRELAEDLLATSKAFKGEGRFLRDFPEHQPFTLGAKLRSRQARARARKRWDAPSSLQGNPSKECNSNAIAMQMQCNSNAGGNALILSSPIPSSLTNNKEERVNFAKAKIDGLRPILSGEEAPRVILEKWNEMAKANGWQVSRGLAADMKEIKKALKRKEWFKGIEGEKGSDCIGRLEFLRTNGLPWVGKKGEHEGWRPTLKWFCSDKATTKILETKDEAQPLQVEQGLVLCPNCQIPGAVGTPCTKCFEILCSDYQQIERSDAE